jgi:transcriptional regulator with XRE-family HTH domain
MTEHGEAASAPARPLYDRVEQIRLKRGLSKIEIADLIGVARSTIDKWQRNRRPPGARTVKDVAERLGIDHDEALRLAGITSAAGGGLQTVPDLSAEEQGVYPDFVGDDLLSRHIWDGPGTEVERHAAISGLQLHREMYPENPGTAGERAGRRHA